MKWIPIAVLVLAALWLPGASSQVLLEVAICVSGLLVVRQAVCAMKYSWAAGFMAVAAFFSLVVRIVLSMHSIAGQTPGSVSL